MKNRINPFQSLLFALLILLSFSACNKSKNKGLLHVPKDATAVFVLKIDQIQSKLKSADYPLDSLLKTKDSIFLLLKDFDLRQPFITYLSASSSMTTGNSLKSGVVAALSSREDLETDLKKLYPDKTILQGKAISYIQLSNGSMTGWNDDLIIGISGQDVSAEMLESRFNLQKEESMADNKNAAKLLNVKSDLSFFINSNQALSRIPFLAMSKASDLVKDNYAGGTLDFEKGQVVLQMSNYFNGVVTDMIKKNPTIDLSGDALASLAGKPLGFAQVAFNTKQIISFLEYAGFKNTVDGYLQKLGTSLADVQKAFKGEIGVALTGVRTDSQALSLMDPSRITLHKTPDFLISIPLADKGAYNKVVGALAKMGIFEQQNGQWVPKKLKNRVYKVTDNAIIIASKAADADAFIAGKGSLEMPEGLDIKNKTSIGYLNLQALIQQMETGQAQKDSSIQLALKTFKDFTFSADNLKDNVGKMKFVLHLQDTKQSSLVVLLNYLKLADRKSFSNISPSTIAGMSDSTSDIVP